VENSTQIQVDTFFSQFQAFSFKVDDILIHNGEKAPLVYYLKSGLIKQSSTSQLGQETTITLYKPGAFFPLIWAIKDSVVPYDFRAMTNGHGWKAPKAEVITFLKQNAAVTFDLSVRLLSGLEGLGRKLEYALQATASLRISEALLSLGYRFGIGAAEIRIDLALTHQKLADMTGLTRETVSRELKVLREKGLIKIDGQTFTITDLNLLEQSLLV